MSASVALDGSARRSVSLPVGHTPVARLVLKFARFEHRLWLKLEGFNPFGSMKDRVACSLWTQLAGQIDPEVGVVESTSGNLGVALAGLAQAADIPFTAIVDPRTSPLLVAHMHRLGAQVVVVDEGDQAGGYLLSRLALVGRMLADDPRLVWTNQYESPANPSAHRLGTAAELARQAPVDGLIVFVPVSTGGTLTGFRQFIRSSGVGWTAVGVDEVGSVALAGESAPRFLTGIGASRRSSLVGPTPGPFRHVTGAQAVECCRWLRDEAGLALGASSGAAVAAALLSTREADGPLDLACVCPDGADRYMTTVYGEPGTALLGPSRTVSDGVVIGDVEIKWDESRSR